MATADCNLLSIAHIPHLKWNKTFLVSERGWHSVYSKYDIHTDAGRNVANISKLHCFLTILILIWWSQMQSIKYLKGISFWRNCGAASVGEWYTKMWFINGVDNVNWPPYRDWKADVLSVSPLSERRRVSNTYSYCTIITSSADKLII